MQSKLLIPTLCCFIGHFAFSQCSSDGAKSPTTILSDASIGTLPLINLTNASASDDNYATVTALALGDQTNYLVSNDFEFAIPASATICGIEVRVERHAAGLLQNVHDNSVRIMKGGSMVGTDKASANTWPSSDSYVTYGGDSDTWGTTWTPADINDSAFGVAHSMNLAGISVLPTARIDHTSTSVHYSMPLPVGIVYFVATREGNQVTVEWATSSEINNDRFEVEFSLDGVQWEKQTELQGAGTSQMTNYYESSMRNESDEISFYRLKQIDFDGTFDYAEIVSVKPFGKGINNKFELLKSGNGFVVQTNSPIASIKIIGISGRTYSPGIQLNETTVYFDCPINRSLMRVQLIFKNGQSDYQQIAFVD